MASGLLVVAILTASAELLARSFRDGQGQPHVPAVILALVLGAVLTNVLGAARRRPFAPGLDFVKKRVLKAAIIVYGLGISAKSLASAGPPVLILVASCLAISLLLSAVAGRLFKVPPRARLLIGCGTAICGATAIVTIAPIVEADDDEVAFAVATIFLFNLVALVVFPSIGHALLLTPTAFGAWVGTAVNDTSAVIATGRAFSLDAGAFATLVKVLRTLALPLVAIGVSIAVRRRTGGGKAVSLAKVFPWFVLGFVATAALAVLAPLPAWLVAAAKNGAAVLVTAVLAGVGLHLDLRQVAGAGARALLLGFTIATVMAAVSLGLVRLLSVG